MVELKFTALKSNGQSITGTVTANSAVEGKKKIQRLAEKNKLKLNDVQKKSTYFYRVRKGKDKPIRGEQKAFSKKEVEEALTRLGYNVLSVNKKLLRINGNDAGQAVTTLNLEQGKFYPLEISYDHQGGEGGFVKLQWSWNGKAEQVIPASYLFHSQFQESRLSLLEKLIEVMP